MLSIFKKKVPLINQITAIKQTPLWRDQMLDWLKHQNSPLIHWTINGRTDCQLSALGLYCKLATIYQDFLHIDKVLIKKKLEQFRDPKDGFFKDSNDPLTIIAETRQAMAGLLNLGFPIENFNLSAYYSKPLFFMTPSKWENPWGAGAQLSHYLFFCHAQNNQKGIDDVLNELEQFQKTNGWYSKKCKSNILINGIMKVFTGFDAIGYKLPKEQLIPILDYVLINHSGKHACDIYDYVYVLTKCLESNYKTIEVKEKLVQIFYQILSFQKKDGGFSFYKRSCQTHIYGRKISSKRRIGDLHGSSLFSMALTRINDCLGLGFSLKLAVT